MLLEADDAAVTLRPPKEDVVDAEDWDVDNDEGATAIDAAEAVGTGDDETIEMEMEPMP